MGNHKVKVFAARAGAAALLTFGMIAGIAGTPAMAYTHTSPTSTGNYTVLGDSYSAGSGGGGESGPCLQSPNGYGNVVAQATGATLLNLACAGFSTAQVQAQEVPLRPADTKLITVTAGGNDVGWIAAVAACLEPTSTAALCESAIASSVYQMRALPKSVTSMLKAIKAKAPGARVIYLGYPRLLEPQNMAALGFTPTQVNGARLLNGAADLLNGVLAYSALSNRVAFIPIAWAFSGHAVPSSDPWLNYPGGPQGLAFHPTATGYANGYAAVITRYLRY